MNKTIERREALIQQLCAGVTVYAVDDAVRCRLCGGRRDDRGRALHQEDCLVTMAYALLREGGHDQCASAGVRVAHLPELDGRQWTEMPEDQHVGTN